MYNGRFGANLVGQHQHVRGENFFLTKQDNKCHMEVDVFFPDESSFLRISDPPLPKKHTKQKVDSLDALSEWQTKRFLGRVLIKASEWGLLFSSLNKGPGKHSVPLRHWIQLDWLVVGISMFMERNVNEQQRRCLLCRAPFCLGSVVEECQSWRRGFPACLEDHPS